MISFIYFEMKRSPELGDQRHFSEMDTVERNEEQRSRIEMACIILETK